MMGQVWRFIEIVTAHPLETAVIGFAIFFVASVFGVVGIMHARRVWRMPMIRLPSPEDRRKTQR
jgi:hypothetical protein